MPFCSKNERPNEENAMSGTDIVINGPAGSFSAYAAHPEKPNGATIIVIQEIFGVNDFVRAIADDYASRGYAAIAPDLFWRIEPGVNITDKSEAEWKKAFDLYSKFNVDGGIEDIQATITHARQMLPANQKVGAVGYCLGGLLAFLTATRTDVDASVGYYGVGIDACLAESSSIKRSLLLHIAEEDGFVAKPAQRAIFDALGTNPNVTLHSYAGVDHAFARMGGEHFDQTAADLANGRTAAFFAESLHK
jgi:carboxymethylenebutenolidase